MPATDQTTADHVDGPAPHTPPAGSSASDLAGDYASRRLGASWTLVLGISAGVREHGLILPEIEDPAAVDRYIDEHLAVARLQEVQRQAANITEELTQVGDQPSRRSAARARRGRPGPPDPRWRISSAGSG